MTQGEPANSAGKKRSPSLVPPSFSITRPREEMRSREAETVSEYVRSPGEAPDASRDHAPSSKEKLLQEWEIEEQPGEGLLADDDVMHRLERIEKRLDVFENTCYTFLLYAKQLSDRTVSFYEDIFGLSKDDLAQIHDRLGINYNNRGDFPKAVEAFGKLVGLQRTPASCYKLGVALDNNGDYQESIEAYRGAIVLDPAYLRAFYKLAEVYVKTENYGEAIRCLTQAAEADPDNPETHYRLGNVHSARGSYDQAINSYQRVLDLAPGYGNIYQALGLAYEQKGEHDRAIEYFKKSI